MSDSKKVGLIALEKGVARTYKFFCHPGERESERESERERERERKRENTKISILLMFYIFMLVVS